MSTPIIEKDKNHSAMPSWSGYNYQGKVAIYSVLEFINNSRKVDLAPYYLELEWYEDFAIKKEDSYLSIHQVKSYKETALSKYKDAIWNLLGKSIESNIKETYIHTSEKIPEIKEIEKKLITYDAPKEKKDNKYTPNYYYNIVMKDGNYQKSFQKFSKYTYCTGNEFCSIDEIDGIIEKQIKEYYKSRGRKETKVQIYRVFLNLLNCLNKHIVSRHKNEQLLGTKTIPININFLDIYDILEADWESSSTEYYSQQLKYSFYRHCESFMHTLHESQKVRKVDLERAEEFIMRINLLDDNSFLSFCKRITPHVSVNKINMQNYRDLVPENGLKMVLINTLINVKQNIGSKHLFQRESQNKVKYFLPTTIDDDPYCSMVSEELVVGKVASNILKNEDLDEFLYEIDAMISKNIKTESLEEAASKINEVPEIDSEKNLERYKRFTKIKKVRMVDISQAKDELK